MLLKKLKLGVVGAGNIFKYAHLPAWNAHPEVEIVAFCDVNENAAAAMAHEHGSAGIYTDYREMLADKEIDMVDITTPNLFHSEVSVAALHAGKHVYCEKPDAINPEEAQRMADEAKKSGNILMVTRNNRFRAESQFLKKYIEKGHMGDIYTGRCGWQRRWGIPGSGWFTNKALSGGGPLIDLGIHFIDLSVWLMGSPKPVSVVGAAYSKFGDKHLRLSQSVQSPHTQAAYRNDVEDLASGFIRFDNGATLQIEFSWASHVEEEMAYLELRGTQAGAKLTDRDCKLFTDIEGIHCDIIPKFPADIHPHTENINHFVDCVQRRAEPIILPQFGVDMVKILSAIYKSAETGSEVKL
ncbi:Gfo/Idh/MocA family oxidoreductase [Paenibacillus sp. J5C_2022]|uniref:Gfo/Idh/MocA family protein n=1 Tax=Paenibacillus sp. J5C2022 TaxID=2977129 RepID=UPI0021D2DE45|nr:Gfo/Idh/MocA family oxidoreductase [Paenibacillus sp. J5C2022]MCU6709666.1 Gfo/Idh/MocA family oxidoreductase [Paenibacillus sp. J5C2022]